MSRLAQALLNSDAALNVMAGDFNYVSDQTDRICGAHGTFVGEPTGIMKITPRPNWGFHLSSRTGTNLISLTPIPKRGPGSTESIATNMFVPKWIGDLVVPPSVLIIPSRPTDLSLLDD